MTHMDVEKTPYVDLTLVGEGNDHLVFSYVSNGLKQVARMPKRRDVIPKVRREVALLERLKNVCSERVSAIIPDLKFSNSNYSFSIMPFLFGQPINEAVDWRFTKDNLKTLALFLSEMHTSPQRDSKILQGLLPVNFKEEKIKISQNIFSNTEKTIINELVSKYLCDNQEWNIAPLHFDLSPIHIFGDKNCSKIDSIIDFSNCKRGDVHFDLYRIYQTLSDEGNWNFFKNHYENFSKITINEEKMFLFGFIQTLNEVGSKLMKADHPTRIAGAKNRTLFLMDEYRKTRV